MGFALLSATVSWIIGIYPALARRRALALRLCHLRRSRPTTGQARPTAGANLLDSLSREVAVVSVDFMQYAESYYFYDDFCLRPRSDLKGTPSTLAGRRWPCRKQSASTMQRC
ncbi:hypothetical protein [Kitasatospora sp. NPDC088346]|uniref:hypothetical protein n=1 Tax=Kitasatospora sp. NPDC088346 TaxID=3364073 RepID=UPI00380295C5